MASPSGTSSGSSSLSSSDQENLQQNNNMIMEIRKRKRMLSNRESARRSRVRKQKHVDDLTGQVAHLRAENNRFLTNMNLVTQFCLSVESENSVLRAQVSELNHRLQALNDIIISCMNSREAFDAPHDHAGFDYQISGDCYGVYDGEFLEFLGFDPC